MYLYLLVSHLFLGISPPRKRSRDLTPKSPLPLFQIEKELGQSEIFTQNSESERSNRVYCIFF